MSDERPTHPTAAHAQSVVREFETLFWDEIRREVRALCRYALEGKRQAAEDAYVRLAALLGITSDVKRDKK